MDKDELVSVITDEIERIFAPDGFQGTWGEYAFLLMNYGVTEEEDV